MQNVFHIFVDELSTSVTHWTTMYFYVNE